MVETPFNKPCEDCGMVITVKTNSKRFCPACAYHRIEAKIVASNERVKATRTQLYEEVVAGLKEKFQGHYFKSSDITGVLGKRPAGRGMLVKAMLERGMLVRFNKRWFKLAGDVVGSEGV